MNRIALFVVLVLISSISYSQFRIDSTLKQQNTWNPTTEKKEVAYLFYWNEQLRPDTVRLRPNQYFDIFMGSRAFKMKFYKITGQASLRKTWYEVTYLGSIVDSLTGTILRDSLYKDSVALPSTNFGEPDCSGKIASPSDSLRQGIYYSWLFPWLNKELRITSIGIMGSGGTTQSVLRVTYCENSTDLPFLHVNYIPYKLITTK